MTVGREPACYGAGVPKTVQIRDLDDDVYARLAQRAAEAGLSVPDLLRREATRLARRPSVDEWLERTRRRPSAIDRADVLEALDEVRGPWPDAGR
jgi:plasmid stability protein